MKNVESSEVSDLGTLNFSIILPLRTIENFHKVLSNLTRNVEILIQDNWALPCIISNVDTKFMSDEFYILESGKIVSLKQKIHWLLYKCLLNKKEKLFFHNHSRQKYCPIVFSEHEYIDCFKTVTIVMMLLEKFIHSQQVKILKIFS